MSPRDRILNPYVQRVDDLRHRLGKVGVFALALLLASIMGFLFAVLPVNLYIIPFIPVIILLLLVLWQAPDIDPELDRPIRFLFLFTLGASMAWPHYIAFVLPGVGFITPYRLSLFLLTGIFLFSLATSIRMRHVIGSALDAAPVTKWSFILFLIVQLLLTIVWGTFISKLLIELFFWHLMFIIAIFCFSFQNVPRIFGVIILLSIPWYVGIAFWEFLAQNKLWMDYVPQFLRGDPKLWDIVDQARFRPGIDRYRASGVLLTSVTLGELIGLVYPFVLWSIFHHFQGWKKLIGIGLLVVLYIGLMSAGSRTGWGGIVVGTAVFMVLWGYRRWKREAENRDLVGPATLWAYPAVFLGIASMVLFWQRAREYVIGGGVHQGSDDARAEQWRRSVDAVQSNPFGYGPGRIIDIIQYYNAAGGATVDGYYMNLLVEYGVPGAILWVAFFLSAILIAARTYVLSGNRDEEVAGAVATGLVSYLVAKYGLSQTELQHLDFALAGMAVALGWRQKMRLGALGQKIDLAPPTRVPVRKPRLRPALP